jgi:hypothetical protein
MFNPNSPGPQGGVDFDEDDFEWLEVLNNTGSSIDFSVTPYIFDDKVGKLDGENITSGILAAGQKGILFNSEKISITDMETMWGTEINNEDINYIAVSEWPQLNNSGGDTIAIWDSFSDYDNELVGEEIDRTTANAVTSLTYNIVAGEGWPTTNNRSSIYLTDLTLDPNVGESWARSAEDDAIGSRAPAGLFQTAVDHEGGDVGSPGFAPPIDAQNLPGDYNQNGVVDAGDYVVWRNSLGQSITLPNDTSPGTVTAADYNVWRENFGRVPASGGGAGLIAVPEPAGAVAWLTAIAALSVAKWGPRRAPSLASLD